MLPVFSYFRARCTIAGSWSFPGAAGQLSGPSSGRPTCQPEPFSWLTSQHLQPASYTLHLQHRSSPPSRSSHFSPFSCKLCLDCNCQSLLCAAPAASTDTPSRYLEASAEQPEGDEVFFDMLVKCQVRQIKLKCWDWRCRYSEVKGLSSTRTWYIGFSTGNVERFNFSLSWNRF